MAATQWYSTTLRTVHQPTITNERTNARTHERTRARSLSDTRFTRELCNEVIFNVADADNDEMLSFEEFLLGACVMCTLTRDQVGASLYTAAATFTTRPSPRPPPPSVAAAQQPPRSYTR